MIMVKPMRDYSAKEVAYYNHMFGVASVFIPSLETQVSLNISWNPQRDETRRTQELQHCRELSGEVSLL